MDTWRQSGRLLSLLVLFLLAMLMPVRTLAMEELKVGYVPGTGFLEEDRPGHMRGNGYEYMEFLSGFLGAKFTYVPCVSWWEAGSLLESGAIDLLPAMPGNYKSLPFAVRTDHVIARFPMELVVQADFAGGQVKLGTLDYNYPTPNLATVAKEHGFAYELVTFHDPAAMKQAFDSHALDGYVQPLLHPGKKERVLALFDRVSYRLLLRNDRPELLARVNAAQDALLLNQPNIRNQLNDKYERAKGFPLVLTPAEIAYLQEQKVLRAAVLVQNKPYFYTDDEGQKAGATMALLAQLEKDLHIKIELVEESSPEKIQQLLARGTVDFVADVPCDFSWLQDMGLTPTQSYLNMGYVPVTRRDAHLTAAPRVAAVKGRFETTTFIRQQYPEEQILYCRSWEECCKAVSSGLADMTYLPRGAVPYLMEAASAYNLAADTESAFLESVSLGVYAQADPRLWQILNKEINHLPPRLLPDALSRGAHENITPLSPRWLLYHYPLQTALLIFVVMGVITGFIYYRSRHHRRQLRAMEQLAFTDRDSQLPNLLYLEQNLDKLLARSGQPQENIYVTLFDLSASSLTLQSSLGDMARQLQERPWTIAVVSGPRTQQLLALGRAASPEEMRERALEDLAGLCALPLGENSLILDIRAGISPLKNKQLADAVDIAAQACQHTNANEHVQVYDQQLALRLAHEADRMAALQAGLAEDTLELRYQPCRESRSSQLVMAQTLPYWQGQPLTDIFAPHLQASPEHCGLLLALDYYLLEQAMIFQRKRLLTGQKLLPLGVPQRKSHLQEPGYAARMRELAEKYDLPPQAIILSFSPGTFASRDKTAQEPLIYLLGELQAAGFGLMAAELRQDIHTAIALSRDLQLALLPGMEKAAHDALLQKLDVLFQQDWLTDEPLTAEKFAALLTGLS